MAKFICKGRLHSHQIARKPEIDDLPAAIIQLSIADQHTFQQRVEMRVELPLFQHRAALINQHFALFEPVEKFELAGIGRGLHPETQRPISALAGAGQQP